MKIPGMRSSFGGNAPSIVFDPQKNNSQNTYAQEHPTLYATTPNKFFSSPLLQNKFYTPTEINPRVFPERYITSYANHNFIEKAMKRNPKITQTLIAEGITPKIEPQNVTSIIHSHLIPTMIYAKDIMVESKEDFTQDEYNDMAKAALLHDIGKTLIPQELLNKKEPLTQKEYEIIKLHNNIGYEILKTGNFNQRVLELVQNHHGYGSVYPKHTLSQILTIADIYSALKEERAYKKAMDDEQAFAILEQGAQSGDYNLNYVNYLRRAVGKSKSKGQ